MSYTYTDPNIHVPKLKDWIGQKAYYYEDHGGVEIPETMDYEVDENTDLTSSKTDTILEQIEKLTLGELDLKSEGGEVVDINGWKPKSSKIDSLKDPYGRVVYSRQDCYEMLYNGEDIDSIKELEWHDDIEKYNKALSLNNIEKDLLEPIKKISKEISEFDDENQSKWFMSR